MARSARLPVDRYQDGDDSKQLTLMVILAQLVGLAIIGVATAWLDLPNRLAKAANVAVVVGLLLLVVGLSWCWWEALWNQADRWITRATEDQARFPTMSGARRKMRVIKTILVLVVGDTVILLLLIRMTGGLGHSPLDPLLPVIPVIAIILGQPRRTVMWALGVQVVGILAAVLHWWMHREGLPHPALQILDWKGYDAYTDQHYIAVFVFVSGGALFLSLVEYVITHTESPILLSIREVRNLRLPNPHMHSAIKAGAKDWIQWLDWRMLGNDDLSVVHGTNVVARQAVILALPYWLGEVDEQYCSEITRKITFLTYGAHWIDDHFDPLRQDDSGATFQQVDPPEIISRSPRVSGLAAHMERLVGRPAGGLLRRSLMQAAAYLHLRTPLPSENAHQVPRAIRRIVYGGLIQNAASEKRLNELLQGYVDFVCEDLSGSLKKAYTDLLSGSRPLAVWMSAKVVLELLDCCSPTFSVDKCEFYNLLCGPILFYHDIGQEVGVEHFGSAFGGSAEEIKGWLPDEETCVGIIKDVCGTLAKELFGALILPEPRREQLELLRKTYRSEIPTRVYEAYDQFMTARTSPTACGHRR